MKCDRCHRPLHDPVSKRYALGPVCREALGVVAMNTEAVEAQRERRASMRLGRDQRKAERFGQLRLPLQLFLPGMAWPDGPMPHGRD